MLMLLEYIERLLFIFRSVRCVLTILVLVLPQLSQENSMYLREGDHLKTTTGEVIKCIHHSTPKTQNYTHTYPRPIIGII